MSSMIKFNMPNRTKKKKKKKSVRLYFMISLKVRKKKNKKSIYIFFSSQFSEMSIFPSAPLMLFDFHVTKSSRRVGQAPSAS